MQEQALAVVESTTTGDAFTVCAYRTDWHQGVVCLVASRLKERFHRPAIVFAPGASGELRGSGRTIGGFHLRDALDLVAKRAVRDGQPVKVLGNGEVNRGLRVHVHAFSATAKEKIAAAGGEATEL